MFNLVIVLFFTLCVALFLVYLIAKHDRKHRLTQAASTPQALLDYRQFSKACLDICEGLKLEITDFSQESPEQIVIRARSRQPIIQVEYLIAGFWIQPDTQVTATQILEISDQVVSERLSKAIVITTGIFDPTVYSLPERAPMEFIDGRKLPGIISQYQAKYI